LRKQKTTRRARIIRPAIPPTTPPTIAPVLLLLLGAELGKALPVTTVPGIRVVVKAIVVVYTWPLSEVATAVDSPTLVEVTDKVLVVIESCEVVVSVCDIPGPPPPLDVFVPGAEVVVVVGVVDCTGGGDEVVLVVVGVVDVGVGVGVGVVEVVDVVEGGAIGSPAGEVVLVAGEVGEAGEDGVDDDDVPPDVVVVVVAIQVTEEKRRAVGVAPHV
jgi:hypothetical protein